MPIWTNSLTFTTGALQSVDICYLVASDDTAAEADIAHSVFLIWTKNTWKALDRVMPWICVSLAVSRKENCAFCIGQWGEILQLDQFGRYSVEAIELIKNGPKQRGPLRRVRIIGGVPFVCGTDRQVYRRGLNRQWQSAGPETEAVDDISSFESIDGFSESSLYAVGLHGEIWYSNGMKWRQLDSPTNSILNDLCCAPDGETYICGRGGIILVGQGDSWRRVEHQFQYEDFWSVVWYDGSAYLASLHSVYRLRLGKLELVDFGQNAPVTCYHLTTANGVLWSIGGKDILSFDGREWARID